MFGLIVGIGALLLSLWQFYVTYLEFKRIQVNGNQNTSAFAGFSIWYSGFYGVIMLLLSIAAFTGAFH